MKKPSFREDLDRAVAFHGHLCGGQLIGTRIARYALEHFGAYETDERPDLVCFVEADRCLADAMTSVAGLSLGRRRLKWKDYGKMAATFYIVKTGEAIRIHTTDARPSDDEDKVAFYENLPDSELIVCEPVDVQIGPSDLPGKPTGTVVCEVCGERVHDGREVRLGGLTQCKSCAGVDTYYTRKRG